MVRESSLMGSALALACESVPPATPMLVSFGTDAFEGRREGCPVLPKGGASQSNWANQSSSSVVLVAVQVCLLTSLAMRKQIGAQSLDLRGCLPKQGLC